MTKQRVVIFEDLAVVRDMLALVFGAEPGFEIAGSFDDGAAGLEKAIAASPTLAIVDYALPGLNGLDVARRLLADVPGIRIVLLTAHGRPEILQEAVDVGIHGVVTKGTPLSSVKEAVTQVVAHGIYRCPVTIAALRRASTGTRAPLTEREREIVQLVASGLSTKEVAARLNLSEKTVTNHRTNVMRKLGVHDVVSLTRYAVERGLVET